ncbi:ABC transporter permease subunit [Anaerocolumna sedimenticola]|uniref:ABC transporter permease subunit n=1 Tax=Anaerocolumna sedimenticola TaxID=2696063 RepID=A0A6P1TII6_9FIRM|nr:ABC transporter permease [Anaerocolumna sedimenticola]QHQ59861.1 ABC transporter permease subunit [Anaerocolumna sedimenticola]
MKYIIQKFTALILTLLLVSFFTFIAFQVIPGDSAVASLGTSATKEAIEALREELGLNKNIFVRYVSWLGNALQGDFGTSSQFGMPVSNLIKDRMPVTLWLAVLSIIFILILSIPLGIESAKKEGGLSDRLITLLTHTAMAIPPFFLGIIITLLFGLVLKWFTPGKYVGFKENFGQFIGYLIYPAIAIAIPKIAMVVKFLRSSLIRQLKMDYVRTARSKGNQENVILYRHVLKNAFIPVITFIAMVIADVLAGSIIIEQVFGLPGMGRMLVTAISNRDFSVVQAIVLYIAAVVILINFIVDILYQRIDPRVRP